MPSILSPEQASAYQRDGYVIVRQLFDAEEIGLLRAAIETDPQLRESLYNRTDAEGKHTRMATWNHPGDSVYGLTTTTPSSPRKSPTTAAPGNGTRTTATGTTTAACSPTWPA